MPRNPLWLIALAAGLALAACSANQQNARPARVAPPSGAATLGPEGTSGMTNSPQSGSASNAASGSSILRQEGPVSGAPLTQ
ncbi:MAG TPA: hypothetical protein VFA50_19570 [Stellaceae bacterium]|nr:hypothetical protein [Stellaceae bacterium]